MAMDAAETGEDLSVVVKDSVNPLEFVSMR